jgi:hypothetical protein
MKKPTVIPRRINSTARGIPVEQTNLTLEEKALLPDPRVVTEDDADAVVAHRRRNEKPIPLNAVLKRYGVRRRLVS